MQCFLLPFAQFHLTPPKRPPIGNSLKRRPGRDSSVLRNKSPPNGRAAWAALRNVVQEVSSESLALFPKQLGTGAVLVRDENRVSCAISPLRNLACRAGESSPCDVLHGASLSIPQHVFKSDTSVAEGGCVKFLRNAPSSTPHRASVHNRQACRVGGGLP